MGGKVLCIAEKPIQAKQLAKPFKHKNFKSHIEVEPCTTFPSGAIIVSAVGHICELADPGEYDDKWTGPWSLNQLPIIPNPFYSS